MTARITKKGGGAYSLPDGGVLETVPTPAGLQGFSNKCLLNALAGGVGLKEPARLLRTEYCHDEMLDALELLALAPAVGRTVCLLAPAASQDRDRPHAADEFWALAYRADGTFGGLLDERELRARYADPATAFIGMTGEHFEQLRRSGEPAALPPPSLDLRGGERPLEPLRLRVRQCEEELANLDRLAAELAAEGGPVDLSVVVRDARDRLGAARAELAAAEAVVPKVVWTAEDVVWTAEDAVPKAVWIDAVAEAGAEAVWTDADAEAGAEAAAIEAVRVAAEAEVVRLLHAIAELEERVWRNVESGHSEDLSERMLDLRLQLQVAEAAC